VRLEDLTLEERIESDLNGCFCEMCDMNLATCAEEFEYSSGWARIFLREAIKGMIEKIKKDHCETR